MWKLDSGILAEGHQNVQFKPTAALLLVLTTPSGSLYGFSYWMNWIGNAARREGKSKSIDGNQAVVDLLGISCCCLVISASVSLSSSSSSSELPSFSPPFSPLQMLLHLKCGFSLHSRSTRPWTSSSCIEQMDPSWSASPTEWIVVTRSQSADDPPYWLILATRRALKEFDPGKREDRVGLAAWLGSSVPSQYLLCWSPHL